MKNKGALFTPKSYSAPVSIKLRNVSAHQIHLKKKNLTPGSKLQLASTQRTTRRRRRWVVGPRETQAAVGGEGTDLELA